LVEPYQIVDIVQMVVTAAALISGLGIVAWAWTRRRAGAPSREIAGLTESIQALRESVEELRHDVADMTDRLDFTERALARLSPPPGDRALPPA
jgi:hypothetical protein